MKLFYMALTLIIGVFLPVQAGINVQLRRHVGDAALAALISFAVGTLALFVYCLVLRVAWPEPSELARSQWWHWTGGFFGAFFVAVTVFAAPRLGAATMLGLIVAGQMLASLVLDHFGLIGYPARPVGLSQLLGAVLLTAGALLIRAE